MIWVLLIMILGIAFLFGGIESALISVSRVRARHAASEGDRSAARLAVLLQRRPELLEAAMAAHHFFSMAAFVVFAVLCRRHWEDWGIVIAVVLGAPVYLIGLELAPKSLFRLYPFRLLRRLTGLLRLLQFGSFLWRAPARVLQNGRETAPSTSSANPGLNTLVNNITSLRLLPADATALLERYAAFAPLSAADLARSWKSISAIPADMPLSSVLPLARQGGRRHYPVLGGDGDVIGFLDAATLPARLPPDRSVRQFTQPLPPLPASTPALRCLQTLRKSSTPLALVTNGHHSAEGIISLEAVLDLLVNLSVAPPSPR